MRTYTEEELLKAVEFACQYQKACCHSAVGKILLLTDGYKATDVDVLALDNLAEQTDNSKEITIDELNDYIDGK